MKSGTDALGLALALLCLLLLSGPVSAQAPFYTDDIGVADLGTLHLEISDELDGLQARQYPDLRQNTATLKINVGLPYGLEFDVDAPFLTIDRTAGEANSRGIGDTNFGLKWQIRNVSPDSRAPAFAVSFYTEYPTGNVRQELGSGEIDYALNLILQEPLSATTRFNVNLGVLFAGNTSTGVVGIETTHGRVYTGGFAMLHDFNDHLTVGAEVYGGMADKNGLDRTQLQSMVGVQYTIREGLSVYGGVLAGTYTASPRWGGQIGIALDIPHVFGSPNPSHPLELSRKPP